MVWLIVIGAITLVVFTVITVVWGIRAHRLHIEVGREELIGRTVEVRSALDPKGMVFIEGEMWTAVSESGTINPGEEAVITKVDSLVLHVARKAK